MGKALRGAGIPFTVSEGLNGFYFTRITITGLSRARKAEKAVGAVIPSLKYISKHNRDWAWTIYN